MESLLDDRAVCQRVLDHIDARSTDMGTETWREPVVNYRSEQRFGAELDLLRRLPIPFCPSAALPEAGSYVARSAAGNAARGGARRRRSRARVSQCVQASGHASRRRQWLHEGVRMRLPRLGVSRSTVAFTTFRTIGDFPTSTKRSTVSCRCTPKRNAGSCSSRQLPGAASEGALDGLPDLIAPTSASSLPTRTSPT
jgi:hypothetical protein